MSIAVTPLLSEGSFSYLALRVSRHFRELVDTARLTNIKPACCFSSNYVTVELKERALYFLIMVKLILK